MENAAPLFNHDDNLSKSFVTKISIVNALSDLCKTRPYSKVGVNDIVAKAGISRSGFYHHFENKNSVIQWLSLQFYVHGLDEIGRTLTWFEGHMITTKGITNYASLFLAAKECQDFDGGQPFFVRHRIETIKETITKYQQKEIDDLLEFQIDVLPHIEIFASERYMKNNCDISIKEYCNKIISTTPKELYHALEHPVQPHEVQGLFFME